MPLAAAADDGCQCGADACTPEALISAAVADCCRLITTACIQAKYTPRCDWPEHQCPTPLSPCNSDICIEPACHKPAVPCTPCITYCLEPACHKPAVVPVICNTCAVDPCECGD